MWTLVRQYSVQTGPFIVSPSVAALSHTEPASAGTSRDSCDAEGQDKSDTVVDIAEMSVSKKLEEWRLVNCPPTDVTDVQNKIASAKQQQR